MKKNVILAVVFVALLTLGAFAQNQTYPQTPVQNDPNQPYQTPVQNDPNQYPQQQYPNQQYPNQQYPQAPVQNQAPVYNQGGTYSGVTIPAGTQLSIRADADIKAQNAVAGQTYPADIAQDVVDPGSGRVIIPRNSPAQITVVDAGNNTTDGKDLALALQSVTVNGQTLMVQSNNVNGSGGNGGIGMNKRTGKYVGGGALIGTVLGAMMGGGKGAAIGAVVGGAGGAGAQVLTRGKQINVPAETVLNFKLDQPLMLQ